MGDISSSSSSSSSSSIGKSAAPGTSNLPEQEEFDDPEQEDEDEDEDEELIELEVVEPNDYELAAGEADEGFAPILEYYINPAIADNITKQQNNIIYTIASIHSTTTEYWRQSKYSTIGPNNTAGNDIDYALLHPIELSERGTIESPIRVRFGDSISLMNYIATLQSVWRSHYGPIDPNNPNIGIKLLSWRIESDYVSDKGTDNNTNKKYIDLYV